MKSLFLAWQAPSRAWFPIGRLNVDVDRSRYVYQYTQGALQAAQQVGFRALPAFPEFHERYESSELFPLFKNRVLDSHRKDFTDYLRSLDLDPENPDPIEILAISGGERQTDSFEVFPKIVKQPDSTFKARFFLHGLRHVAKPGQERGLMLQPNEELQVSIELNNPRSKCAIQLTSSDYHFLGWAPRYLVSDLLKAIATCPEVNARVVRINAQSVPQNRRILIELFGRFPDNVEPMSGSEFQVLH